MGWAAGAWHIVESRAVIVGIIARPGGPIRLLDLDPRVLLAFIEGMLRESEEATKLLDRMYADAALAAVVATPVDRYSRAQDIERALRAFS